MTEDGKRILRSLVTDQMEYTLKACELARYICSFSDIPQREATEIEAWLLAVQEHARHLAKELAEKEVRSCQQL